MPKAQVPGNEVERLRTLASFCILDTPPEVIYDDLTGLAARLCDTPIAILCLVDADRQWFKSAVGLETRQTHRDCAFCAHAILEKKPFVISNAEIDPRTRDNPLVTGSTNFQFYAGIPLITKEGHALGTLCVIDTKPRGISDKQLDELKLLARQVMSHLEIRLTNQAIASQNRELANSKQQLTQIAAEVPGVVYQYQLHPDGRSCFPYASEGIRKIYRVAPDEVKFDATMAFNVLHPDDCNEVAESIRESARTLLPWQKEYRVRFSDGEVRWHFGNATPVRLADNSVVWHGFITDITQNRSQREEVEQLRSQLQAIVDASTQRAIIATDLNGCITVFNTGAQEMLGYSEHEMVGRQTPRCLHLESEILARSAQLSEETGRHVHGFDVFVEYARQGRHDARTWTYVRKDGSRLIVSLVVTSIRDSNKRLVGFLGIANDITAAVRIEHELRDERQRVNLALDCGELGTWDWNIQTGEELYDKRWASIIGERLEDLPPDINEWTSRVHSDDMQNVWKIVQEHLAGRTTLYDAKFRMRHKDGSWRWIVARGRLTERDEKGNPLRMLGTIVDVTAQVSAEKALHETESRFQALAAFAPIGIFQTDLNGKCIFTNDRWQTISGFTLDESLGSGWSTGIHVDDHVRVMTLWNQFVTEKGTFEAEYRFVRPNGEVRFIHSKARKVELSYDQCIGFVGINEDITERIEAERTLILAREKAETANQSKSSFLANMSHEIRTPLTAILGHTELLRDPVISIEERNSSLETIERSGDHLLTILNDILDLSKIESGKLSIEHVVVSPTKLVAEVLDYFREICKAKNNSLSHEADGLIPDRILSDPVRLRQILVNLIGNAAKFTSEGTIRVVYRFIPEQEGQLPQMVFDVIDTGVGISFEQSALLFSPFVQADNSTTRQFGGTGLGLTISRRLARLLGGDVAFTSIPNQGSTFTASVEAALPVDDARSETRCSSLRNERASATSTIVKLVGRILVAEDSQDIQRLVKAFLTKAGATVEIADNGQIAVDLLSNSRNSNGSSEHDLIILDMQMPVMDGCEAATEMRRRGFKGPIVMLTANAMHEDREKCLAAGCNDFATKPIDRNRLLTLCHAWMAKSSLARMPLETEQSSIAMEDLENPSSQQSASPNVPISNINTNLFEVLRALTPQV